MSHGVKRARESADVVAARREKERSKLNAYLELTDDVLARKRASAFTQESFDLTTKLLGLNPELYSIWNYRRLILLNGLFPNLSPEGIFTLLQSELNFTTGALKVHPKVYWIWNHRRWCLANVPPGPDGAPVEKSWKRQMWTRELFIDERMLEADARNFHAWNYRRNILASDPGLRTLQDELTYTKKKIEASFSNFSAWHQRSKVYTALWEEGSSAEDVRKVKDTEFEFVQQALYTDPGDQSAWLYHRWLIGNGEDLPVLKREIAAIEELLSVEPDSKWCLETLVHYKRLLTSRSHMDETELAALKKETNVMLEKLQGIDPKRRIRYQELGM
ncbi:rab-protein geranylgeranyltransferase [Dacryopinax primogenitus]|uniref:Geranylgeranyl transferase type-2 subunit alpha n=1 Tax=Dacryopinax primogenitus (strain DJM 731) TaxID=1858805 RepID=M5FPE1_DACPD|nr:rab-protein geranylgeranyltransferase [Dacryopinax primogenitus]EJT98480.1 rab-protein geranylgeranyltransferase [Dacryopinax primogenitus]